MRGTEQLTIIRAIAADEGVSMLEALVRIKQMELNLDMQQHKTSAELFKESTEGAPRAQDGARAMVRTEETSQGSTMALGLCSPGRHDTASQAFEGRPGAIHAGTTSTRMIH